MAADPSAQAQAQILKDQILEQQHKEALAATAPATDGLAPPPASSGTTTTTNGHHHLTPPATGTTATTHDAAADTTQATSTPASSIKVDASRPRDFEGEVTTNDDIPTADTLRRIEDYVVLDRHGKSLTFKSLYQGKNVARRVLVIFVRHFFCGVRLLYVPHPL